MADYYGMAIIPHALKNQEIKVQQKDRYSVWLQQ